MTEITFRRCQKSSVLSYERAELSSSMRYLCVFEFLHVEENLRVFQGPRDFNSYGHSDARLWETGFGLRNNIVEKYVLLCEVLQERLQQRTMKQIIDVTVPRVVILRRLS